VNQNLSDGAKAFLEAGIRGGGVVSDGPVGDDFTRGWALHPLNGGRAHWWQRNGATLAHGQHVVAWLSACGIRDLTSDRAPMLGAGSYPMCKRCDAGLLKRKA
jgi:hypothetical protein